MTIRQVITNSIARSPRLTALLVWYVWRRCPEARPGLYALMYNRERLHRGESENKRGATED